MAEAAVLDASAFLAVLLNEFDGVDIRPTLENRNLLAPELIRYETANGILMANRQDRDILLDRISLASDYPIYHPNRDIWWNRAEKFIQTYSITFYDATYLSLASNLELTLITLDKKLRNFCRAENIDIFPTD